MAAIVTTSGLSALLEASERAEYARAAILEAQKLRPRFLALARMIGRNPKLKLEFVADGSRTDSNTVWLQVPIELGMKPEHDLALCGYRDELLVQECEACASREEIIVNVVHEMAHLVHGTFNQVSDRERVAAIQAGIKSESKGKPEGSRAKKILKKIEDLPPHMRGQFLPIAHMISPYLPMVVNALEDTRVNLATEHNRKGMKLMFAASHARLLKRGVRLSDTQVRFLKEASPNMQALMVVFMESSGIPFKSFLDEEIERRLDDPELHDLLSKARKLRSINEVFQHSIPVLERLRELGFCLSPEDEQDDEPEPQPEESNKGEDGDESSSGGGSDDQPASNETGEDSTPSAAEQSGDTTTEEPGESSNGDDKDTEGDAQDADNGGEGSSDEESSDSDSGEGNGAGEESGEDAGSSDSRPQSSGSGSGDSDGSDADGEPPNDAEDSPGSSGNNSGSAGGKEGSEGGGQSTAGSLKQPYTAEQQQADGTPDDLGQQYEAFAGHAEFGHDPETPEEQAEAYELDRALNQAQHFDRPSDEVEGLQLFKYGEQGPGWSRNAQPADRTAENILGSALMRLRIAFTDNRKFRKETRLKKGRVDGKSLHRVAVGDVDVFQKKNHPGKKDYFVEVGFDISSSTKGHKAHLIKSAVFAQAELLNRLGVKFAIHAHSCSGGYARAGRRLQSVEIFEVKAANEPWSTKTKEALDAISEYGYNLDGHSLEFYRKVAQQQNVTDKVVLFYTDGALNSIGEEYDVFTENVKLMRKLGITCVGVEVGVNSGMTEELGMDTVRIDGPEDIIKVVRELEKRLS